MPSKYALEFTFDDERENNNVKYKEVLEELFKLNLTDDEFNQEFKKRTGYNDDVIDTFGMVTIAIYDPSMYRFHPVYDHKQKIIEGDFH